MVTAEKKQILVIGAAGGVGLEVTKQLLGKNYAVIGTVLNEDEAALVEQQAPGTEKLVIMDLSDADTIKPVLDKALDKNRLDGVAICAAIGPMGPLELEPLAGLRKTLEINTVADVAVYQACMPHLRQTKGRLVIIVSNAGRSAFPFLGHYVASKFALEGLGDVMRREAARFGVKVSLIEPGGIKTNMPKEQTRQLISKIEALSEQDKALYGDFFLGFKGLLKGAAYALEPDAVAETVVTALEEPQPKSRYQLGQDAIDTIHMALTASDAEIDAFWEQVFASGLAAAEGELSANLVSAKLA